MSVGEIEFLTEEQVKNDPELTAEAYQKWLDKVKEEKEWKTLLVCSCLQNLHLELESIYLAPPC